MYYVDPESLERARRERLIQHEKYEADVASRHGCVACLNSYVWAVIFGNIVIACGFVAILLFGVETVIGQWIQSI